MLLHQVHIIYMRVIDVLGKLDIIYCNEIMGFVRLKNHDKLGFKEKIYFFQSTLILSPV